MHDAEEQLCMLVAGEGHDGIVAISSTGVYISQIAGLIWTTHHPPRYFRFETSCQPTLPLPFGNLEKNVTKSRALQWFYHTKTTEKDISM